MIVKCRVESGTLMTDSELRVVVRARLAGDHVVGRVCRRLGVRVVQRRGAVAVRVGEPAATLDVRGLYRLLVGLGERAMRLPWVRPPGNVVEVDGAWVRVWRGSDPREAYLALDAPRRGLLPALGVEVVMEPGDGVMLYAKSPDALSGLGKVVVSLRLLAAVM